LNRISNLNVIGLDISEKMLEEARKRSDKTFVQGSSEKLKFKDSTFNAVLTVTILEFLDDYEKGVREIARVAKFEGKLLAMMLSPKSEYFREEIKKAGGYLRRIKYADPKQIRDYIL
jgi:ubiquinone/menaquinone biosynthesis C-methylase UbiE